MAQLARRVERFLRAQRVARLATADARGRPHVVPIVFVYSAGRLYTPIDLKPKSASPRRLQRVRNILANPRVQVLIDQYEEDWQRLGYVQLRGPAELIERGDEHLGRGGLAVGSGDHHHTAGNRGHQLVDHQWVEHFSNEPGNGRTAPPDETAQETGEAPDGDGDDQTEHGPTIPAGSKAALLSSGSSRELGPEEIGVQAIELHQVLMPPLFDQAASIKHEDPIRRQNRREPVSDHKGGAPLHHPLQGLLNQGLGSGIQMRCGFVQHQDSWVLEDDAGDCHALLLAA